MRRMYGGIVDNNKKIIIGIVILFVLVMIGILVWYLTKPKQLDPWRGVTVHDPNVTTCDKINDCYTDYENVIVGDSTCYSHANTKSDIIKCNKCHPDRKTWPMCDQGVCFCG